MRKLFFLFLALVTTTNLWAEDFSIDGIYYNYLDGNNVEVTYRGSSYSSYDEYSGEVIIPETVTYNGNAYSVTSIGESAFYACSLTSVTIPASVISIEEYNFYESKYIKTVYLKSTTPPILNGGKIFDTSRPTCYIPCGTLDTYKASKWANLMKQFVEECEEEDSTNIITYTSSDGKVVQPYKTDAFGANIVSNEYKDGQGVITFDGPVTSIGRNAFSKCSSLTSVTIPESVTSIGWYAFSDCSSLTSVTIPNSVTSIGNSAFSGCSSLTSIVVESGNTTYDNRDNCNAIIETATNTLIAGCQNTTIPNSVTCIGESAFYACSLTSVTIPASVISIEEYNFYESGIKTVYLKSTTPPILNGGKIFADSRPTCYIPCGTLDTYKASEWANLMKQFVEECEEEDSTNIITYTSSDGKVVQPYKTDVFGANIVSNEYKDGKGVITFDGPVTSIGYGAFENCSSLTSITIPNSVTSIGYGAFENCSSLTSITIPESVTTIGSSYGCSSLTTVVWNAIICDYSNDGSIFGNSPITSITFGENVKIIPNCICSMLNLLTSVTIPESVTSIGYYAFAYCSSLTSITIPNSVTSIGYYAFSGCSALTSVTIGNSVTSIGYGAFENCSSLTSITIPESVTSIGGYAFSGCIFTKENFTNNSSLNAEANNYWDAKVGDIEIDGLLIKNDTLIACRPYVTIAVIPNSVTSIGYGAFSGCSSLTSVTIPESVTSIGGYAFSGCSSLTSVTIPNSVTSIGESAFRDCSSLTSVTIGNSVTSIRKQAFSSCRSLTSITIPNSVTSIGGYAFYSCSSLTSITIPNSVTSIGSSAFAYCSALTSITIPESVTSIGSSAFENCSSVTSITCEARIPPTIGIGAIDPFAYVNKSIPVYVPCGCVSAYNAARSWKDFTNIQELQAEYSIKVSTSNNQMGSAKVDYNTFCDGNQITATANYGYHFTQWSDGVTDNPRTITLTQDTVLMAEFALTTAGQCGKNLYWVYDTNKSTLTITGSGDMYNERPWGLLAANLTEVALPEGLTHIGDDAFTNCNNLKAITIPASVTSIGANSFAGCRNLRNVNCYPLLPPYAETTSFANYNVNLNVPCDYLEDYQYDIVFGSFKYIQCISSDEVEDTEDVEIDAGTTDVTIVWPSEDNAYTYTILIKKNGQVVCTLVFDAYGRLLNIAFAPGRDGNHTAQYAEQTGTGGFRFTVTGLEEGTDYTYDITTADESDNTISTHTGEFTTKSNTPTDLENNDIQYPISDTRKLLRDNQLYILHNGKTYNVMGAEIK